MGSFGRGVYVVQTNVNDGSSGGPIVLQSGAVAGVIFSKSTTVENVAYALTSVHINDALQQVQSSYSRVSTGACIHS
jgi:S1-C subfamily serine protease